jgi:hypothetical protein
VDGEHSHVTENAKEPNGRGDAEPQETADLVTEGEGPSQIAAVVATDEPEDLAGETRNETGIAAEVEVLSGASEGVHPNPVAKETTGIGAESELEAEAPVDKQEVHHAATPVESLAEAGARDDLVDRRVDHGDRLAAEPQSEEFAATDGEVTGGEFDDSTVFSDVAKTAEPSAAGDLDALERDARGDPDECASDEVGAEISEGDAVSTGNGASTSTGAGDSTAAPGADAVHVVPSTTPRERERRRRTPQYRAPAGGPSSRQPSQSRTTVESVGASPTRSQPAPIEVRVLFQCGGYCLVSLLPKRPAGLPEELVVSGEAGDVELLALQDEWYQDVAPDNLANILRTGFVWRDPGTGQEWLLSGREVFVLAHGTAHRGFVSCPRLALGRDHVVLCTATQLTAVEDVLREAGCSEWTQLGGDDGVPAGWTLLRGIVPKRPIPLSNDADILNVLRPLPEIEIALDGGIRLAYNSWLLGHPPTIHVYGDPEHIETVLIDGQEAVGSDENGYTVPGWDAEGDHHIWCSSSNKSYSLVRCEATWAFWPAYSFSLGGTKSEGHEFTFCGPLVRPAGIDYAGARRPIQVPPSNPVLVGAQPGEVFFAQRRRDVRGAQCLGLPPFDPVWALPAQPLHCDKRTNRILLVEEPMAVRDDAGERLPAAGGRDRERWCRVILDASRKGLEVEPASPATQELWRAYKQRARSLWKLLRRKR